MARMNHDQFAAQRRYAADVLARHRKALLKHVDGVREASDVECVHKMRVASRRLRNAMGLYEDLLPRKDAGRWLKAIKKVTRSLGAARDLDVQILFLKDFDERLGDRTGVGPAMFRESVDAPPRWSEATQNGAAERLASHLRPGIERLMLRLQQQRAHCQPDLIKTMDRLRNDTVLDEMDRWITRAVNAAPDIAGYQLLLQERARRVVLRRLEDMLAYEPYIEDPAAVEHLHRMRIAAKHLRYTLEAYGRLYEDGLREQVGLAKDLQQQLGDIHDCDVWIAMLPRFLANERGRYIDFYGYEDGFGEMRPGIEHLLADHRRTRERLYGRFLTHWRQQKHGWTWDHFRQMFEPTTTTLPLTGDESFA